MILKENLPVNFYIGKIPVRGDLILAPMDGITDSPFRCLARRFGSSLSYTEFINAIDVIHWHPHLDERLVFREEERPLVLQLLDNDPDRLEYATGYLLKYRPDILDVNLGCCAKSVSGRGAGAGLLRDPIKVAEIIHRLSRFNIPITAKIRLGWDDTNRNYLEIAKVVEENGGKLLAVHARTRQQTYTGQADWDAIAEVKQAVGIPVIGNGDVRTITDIETIKKHTGCDGVMIARAALGNPWIFSRIDRQSIAPAEVLRVMLDHLSDMLAFYGAERGLTYFRKHTVAYLHPYSLSSEIRTRLLTCPDPADFIHLLQVILGGNSHR